MVIYNILLVYSVIFAPKKFSLFHSCKEFHPILISRQTQLYFDRDNLTLEFDQSYFCSQYVYCVVSWFTDAVLVQEVIHVKKYQMCAMLSTHVQWVHVEIQMEQQNVLARLVSYMYTCTTCKGCFEKTLICNCFFFH